MLPNNCSKVAEGPGLLSAERAVRLGPSSQLCHLPGVLGATEPQMVSVYQVKERGSGGRMHSDGKILVGTEA